MRAYHFSCADLHAMLRLSTFPARTQQDFLRVLERGHYSLTDLVQQIFDEGIPSYVSVTAQEYLDNPEEDEHDRAPFLPQHERLSEFMRHCSHPSLVVHIIDAQDRVSEQGFHAQMQRYCPISYEEFANDVRRCFSDTDADTALSEMTQVLGFLIEQVESVCLGEVRQSPQTALFTLREGRLVVFVH